MAALSENIGILMRIRVDSDQAKKEFKDFKKELKEIDEAGKDPLARLAHEAGLSAQQFSNLKTGALAAVAGITAVAAVAVTAAVQLFQLTKAASEYGSKIFDASQKSGASVETIQALGFAAQQSGSSLEQISTSISKFATLIGQAQLGNEKAQKTLEQFGITATDVDGALVQAIDSISKMKDSTLQNAAAAALFKDRGGDVINTIREMGGNLPDTIKKLRDLGVMLSEEDTKAADAFGDSLDTLTQQVKTAGYKFAFEFMPQITSSIRQIIQWLSANSGEVRKWGQIFRETLSGVKVFMAGLLVGANSALNGINNLFGISARNAITWSTVMQGALGPIVALLRMISNVGSVVTDEVSAGTSSALSAVKAPGIQVPNMPTFLNAGGGSGGGGRAKRDTTQEDADRIAERNLRARIQIAQNLLSEFQQDFSDAVATGLENLTGTDDESITALKSAFGEYLEQIQRAMTALHRLQDQERANMTDAEKDLLTQKQRLEKEKLRLDIKNELLKIDKAAADFDEKEGKKAQERIDAELKALEAKMLLLEKEAAFRRSMAAPIPAPNGQPDAPAGPYGFDIGGSLQAFIDLVKTDGPTINQTLQEMGNIATSAFGQIAQGIGSMVEAWVLMGTAGPNAMRKMVASVLAGVAAQAAVLAIFELAKGFAALWLNPGEAAMHFKAAALFGVVAVGAALGGRAVAGDAFKTQTASATGRSTSSQQGENGETRYTTAFQGYGQNTQSSLLIRTLDRINTTIGQAEETFHDFKEKFGTASPGAVVMAGAKDASRDIRDAVIGELNSDVGTTNGMMRGLGFAR